MAARKPRSEQADTLTGEDAAEAGLFGVEVDPTPNSHYTVAGVTAGKPTPETDAATAEKARKAAGLR